MGAWQRPPGEFSGGGGACSWLQHCYHVIMRTSLLKPGALPNTFECLCPMASFTNLVIILRKSSLSVCTKGDAKDAKGHTIWSGDEHFKCFHFGASGGGPEGGSKGGAGGAVRVRHLEYFGCLENVGKFSKGSNTATLHCFWCHLRTSF